MEIPTIPPIESSESEPTSWQGLIVRRGGKSLGSLGSVARTLSALLPGLTFAWSKGGAELLRDLDASELDPPESFRALVASRPRYYCGRIDHGGATVGFNLGSGGPVRRAWVDVEGPADACRAVFALLASPRHWRLVDEALQVVDETAPGDTAGRMHGATLIRRGR
jgi:hypothetical protein